MSERFGEYELIHRIGVGGMAEVWVARQYGAQGFVKELVIKRILEQFNEDPDFVSMFVNEARLASRLQHANIVQVYGFDQVDGVYYIAMEYVNGPDLRKVSATARKENIPIPQTLAVHVGVEALKGLHYAHTRQERGKPLGIVHRDISPHNLLLSYAGEVKVTDFGIAKVAALASATRTGMVKGKLTYMSPEQMRGDHVDARADLYALGIVLWELLAGCRIYGHVGSEGELMAAVRQGRVTPLREVAPHVPAGLCEVVDRFLVVDVEKRYSTAADALADLSSFAGATDELVVSEYLLKLLPMDADRDKGLASLESSQNKGLVTPLKPITEGADVEERADINQEDPVLDDEVFSEAMVLSQYRKVWPIILIAGLIFVVCGLGAWALTGLLTQRVDHKQIAQLNIKGKNVEVEGIPLGEGENHKITGFKGGVLNVKGDFGEKKVELGEQDLIPGDQKADKGSHDARIQDVSDLKQIKIDIEKTKVAPKDSGLSVKDIKIKEDIAIRADLKQRTRHRYNRDQRTSKVSSLKPSRRPTTNRNSGRVSKKKHIAAKGMGSLKVVVSPWAIVYVDGKKVGITPVTNYRLRAGRHLVVIKNSELAKKSVERIYIKANRLTQIRKNW